MTDVFFDEQDIAQRVNRVLDETQIQRIAHLTDAPSFPPSAAGRDFAGHGARIQEMLERLHERGTWRLDNIASHAEAVRAQVQEFSEADIEHSGNLTRVTPDLAGGEK